MGAWELGRLGRETTGHNAAPSVLETVNLVSMNMASQCCLPGDDASILFEILRALKDFEMNVLAHC